MLNRIKIILKQELFVLKETNIIYYFHFYSNLRSIVASIERKLPAHILSTKNPSDDISENKYSNYKFWVKECLIRFYKLKLYKQRSKLNILDLGTGFGFFPYICKTLKHGAECLDSPDSELYSEVISYLGLTRYEETIEENKPILLNGSNEKYDLITAFMICFNNHKTKKLWGEAEWRFFISDMYNNHLSEGGSIYLNFNKEDNGLFFDHNLRRFFEKNSYTIDGNNVHISHPPKD